MKNVTKKLLAVAVALMMILAVIPMSVAAAPTVPTSSWWGNHDYSWYTGHENDTTYEIDTPAELAGLIAKSQEVDFAGKTIYITKDIDLSAHKWYRVGTSDKFFAGSIIGKKDGVEGAAVKISNMMIDETSEKHAFIGFMSQGTIANLVFDNAYVTSNGWFSIVVAQFAAAGTITFENVTVQNSELLHKVGWTYSIAGFMIGRAKSNHATNNPVIMNNCSVVNSTISDATASTATITFGGLVGAQDSGSVALNGCKVLGTTISSQSTGTVKIGSFVGSYSSGTCTMTDCMVDAIGSYNLKPVGIDATTYDITAPTMLDGASIRTTEGENGLRFTSVMSKANLDKLGATYSFGTVIAVATELAQDVTFTEAGLKAAGVTKYTTIKAVNGIYENYDGANGVKFNAALVDIADKATEFAARSYVDVTANGLTIRVYSAFDAEKNERSMEYVANKALNDVKDVKEEATANGFAYCFEVEEYNSDATGATCTMTAGTKYSCYAPTEWAVLKTWASAS